MGVAISTLANVSWTNMSDGVPLPAATLNSGMNNADTGVNQLQGVVQDLEKSYASASAPTDTPQGKLWTDTGNSQLWWYKTAGVKAQILAGLAGSATTYSAPATQNSTIRLSGVDSNSYVSATGTLGSDASASIVKQITLKANTLRALGNGARISCLFAASTSTSIVGTLYLGTAGTSSDLDLRNGGQTMTDTNARWVIATVWFASSTSIHIMPWAPAGGANFGIGQTTNINCAADMFISVGQTSAVATHLTVYAIIIEPLG